jgi:hypothetical protein
MGYRGKVKEQEEARRLRAEGRTLSEIADELRVSKGSVSKWVRDVPLTPSKRRYGPHARWHPWKDARLREIAQCDQWGEDKIGRLSDHAFLAAGTALYVGEGSKTDGKVVFANTDSAIVSFFCAWLRQFFDIDESRLRVRVYLHDGLDLDLAEEYWSDLTGVARSQFGKPYRATADSSIRTNKHAMGCVYVCYNSTRVHRQITGLIRALLSCEFSPG